MRHATQARFNTLNAITGLRTQQIILLICSAMYVLPGIALVFAPTWFYDAIADFPPFNRHYMGDAGVFSFALGVGLLLAVRKPRQNLAVIIAAAVGAGMHLLNHMYDDFVVDGGHLEHLLSNSLPLGITALLLVWVWWAAAREK